MAATLTIGDFSRATHLSVKALRHYHDAGLLAPAAVDPENGYRRYALEQIATAQIIRRFRELSMPLDTIREVMAAPDVAERNLLIAEHLDRLEQQLAQTQTAVIALRGLLQPVAETAPIVHRSLAGTSAAAVSATIDVRDAGVWMQGALAELYAFLRVRGVSHRASAGGIFATEIFTEERGDATIFVPCEQVGELLGRVTAFEVAPVELATIVHRGGHATIDRAYGMLASYVTRHALAVSGPIREYYVVGPLETSDEEQWQTEIGWPIFRTQSPP